MRIYSCGDSFTYGEELENPKESAWPILLGKKLNALVFNDASSGGSNFRTVYQVTKNIKDDYDLYIIAWTDYSRYTFYNSQNNYQINFSVQLKDSVYSKESFYKDFGNLLYKHWYNELYAVKIWLQQIIHLQKILENKKYLMINTFENKLSKWDVPKDKFINLAKNLINFNLMDDKQIFDEYDEIQYYISLIDFSKFYRWNKFFIGQLTTQFPIGKNGHILEEGHEHLANLIYKHV